MGRVYIFVGLFALHNAAFGQDAQTGSQPMAISAEQPPLINSSIILPAMTQVRLTIMDGLNSKTNKMGQFFDIRLAEPIMLDGRVIVPAGTRGKGEIVHAAKARAAGKAGELIIAARYLDFGSVRIPLRTLKYGEATTGKSKADEAAAVGIIVAAPLALFFTGGQVDVPAGMPATAKLAADVRIDTISQQEEKP